MVHSLKKNVFQSIWVVPPPGKCYTDSDSFADSDDDFSDDGFRAVPINVFPGDSYEKITKARDIIYTRAAEKKECSRANGYFKYSDVSLAFPMLTEGPGCCITEFNNKKGSPLKPQIRSNNEGGRNKSPIKYNNTALNKILIAHAQSEKYIPAIKIHQPRKTRQTSLNVHNYPPNQCMLTPSPICDNRIDSVRLVCERDMLPYSRKIKIIPCRTVKGNKEASIRYKINLKNPHSKDVTRIQSSITQPHRLGIWVEFSTNRRLRITSKHADTLPTLVPMFQNEFRKKGRVHFVGNMKAGQKLDMISCTVPSRLDRSISSAEINKRTSMGPGNVANNPANLVCTVYFDVVKMEKFLRVRWNIISGQIPATKVVK